MRADNASIRQIRTSPSPAKWEGSARSIPIAEQIGRIVTGPWHGTDRSRDWHRSVRPVQSTGKPSAYPFGRILGRVDRIASVVHIGSCWNAFIWLRNEWCKQTW
jgi:hypothetical protein